jgi:hypothetical protein
MTSTVPAVEALLAGFTELTRVSGEPTFEDITIARQHLNQNCMNIKSYNGGGNHGHLELVMTQVEYIMQTPGVAAYIRPPKPDATSTITAEATPVAAQNLIMAHVEEMRAYRLATNVDKACCKSILDAFDHKFLAARADPVVRYANETAISLITHLKDFYAFNSPIELVANYEQMCQTYEPSHPIEDLFRQMQDGRAYAQAGQQPYGKHQIINIAYALVFNTCVYSDACEEWEKHDILEKTWENFKAHFTTKHHLYRKQTQTAQTTGYQAANHAQRNLPDALMVEQLEALAMLASASATDRTTLSHLVSSSAQLLTNLAEKVAALAAANEIIRNLQAGARTSGGPSTANATRSAPSATPRARPATNNENDCWSHYYQIHEDHTSMACTIRAAGHQEAATKANNMGGRQWGRDAV